MQLTQPLKKMVSQPTGPQMQQKRERERKKKKQVYFFKDKSFMQYAQCSWKNCIQTDTSACTSKQHLTYNSLSAIGVISRQNKIDQAQVQPDSVSITFITLCFKKAREQVWNKVEGRKGQNLWPQAKHAKLYSDLPQADKMELFTALDSQQKGPQFSASAGPH